MRCQQDSKERLSVVKYITHQGERFGVVDTATLERSPCPMPENEMRNYLTERRLSDLFLEFKELVATKNGEIGLEKQVSS